MSNFSERKMHVEVAYSSYTLTTAYEIAKCFKSETTISFLPPDLNTICVFQVFSLCAHSHLRLNSNASVV
jgi:hypothetical protein